MRFSTKLYFNWKWVLFCLIVTVALFMNTNMNGLEEKILYSTSGREDYSRELIKSKATLFIVLLLFVCTISGVLLFVIKKWLGLAKQVPDPYQYLHYSTFKGAPYPSIKFFIPLTIALSNFESQTIATTQNNKP